MADECVYEELKNELFGYISEQNIDELQSFVTKHESHIDKKLILEHSLRTYLLQMVTKDGWSVQSCCSFLDYIVSCVKQNICCPTILFVMISDLSEISALNVCSEIFSYVENKVETWKTDVFYIAGKNYLLRLCNDLLKRLSRAKNTVFCGRIQLFLARLFPLEEKSGLNLMSQFNTENSTVYNVEASNTRNVDDEEKTVIDFNLYKKFWSLQSYFNKPTQCYEKDAWEIFVANSEEVLNCFESSKLENVKISNSNTADSFFAKYLTSDKLLNLQLSDSNFRKNILLQLLVTFQFLSSQVKFKQVNHVLTESQEEWLKMTNERVFKIIKELPDGEEFAQIIEHLLNRENNWNSWKNEGCRSFVKTRSGSKNSAMATKRKSALMSDMKSKMIKLGNHHMDKLWNLKVEDVGKRNCKPDVEKFIGEALEQMDPEACVDEKYKSINNPLYAWKAWRLLATQEKKLGIRATGKDTHENHSRPPYLEKIIGLWAKDDATNKEDNQKVNGTDRNSVKHEEGDSGLDDSISKA